MAERDGAIESRRGESESDPEDVFVPVSVAGRPDKPVVSSNAAECRLRTTPVGRKNWLFAGSDNGGRTAAILMSFTQTCKSLGIDPYAYLRDVRARIASHPIKNLHQLLPDNWQALYTTPQT